MKKNKYLILSIAILSILFLVLISFNYTSAYKIDDNITIQNPGPFREGEAGVSSVIERVFNVAIVVSEIVFVVLLLIGGIQYLTSAGNDDSAGKARKLMLNAVIGLVIVLASWGIGTWVLDVLKTGQGATPAPTGIPTSTTTGLPTVPTIPTSTPTISPTP